MQYGGKIYGKGSKGFLIDLFNDTKDEKSESSFIKKSDTHAYLINAEGKVKISIDDLTLVSREKFLIKQFNDIDNYISEMHITTQLINSNIIDDFIIYPDRDTEHIEHIEHKKYYGIQNESGEYGILKHTCFLTADQFKIVSSSGHLQPDNSYSLSDFCRQILDQIINLQNNNYAHCDIKADNIMLCPSLAGEGKEFKLIDWDLAVSTTKFIKSVICLNKYFGSATHTSPMLEKSTKELCGMKTFGQSLKRVVSTSILERRGVLQKHNLINDITKEYLLTLNPSSLISLYKYHIDLYSFSITLFELLEKNKNDCSVGIENFCAILQNTVFVSSDKNFIYISSVTHQQEIPKDLHEEITYDSLLSLIPNNYYLM